MTNKTISINPELFKVGGSLNKSQKKTPMNKTKNYIRLSYHPMY